MTCHFITNCLELLKENLFKVCLIQNQQLAILCSPIGILSHIIMKQQINLPEEVILLNSQKLKILIKRDHHRDFSFLNKKDFIGRVAFHAYYVTLCNLDLIDLLSYALNKLKTAPLEKVHISQYLLIHMLHDFYAKKVRNVLENVVGRPIDLSRKYH